MRRLYTLIIVLTINYGAMAQEKIESIVIGNGIIRTQDRGDIIGRFYKNNAGDTVIIDLKEYIPLKKSIPTISRKLAIPKDKTTILKIKEPDNTIVYQELNILAPKTQSTVDTLISPISFGYTIGRHTDQFNIRYRYIDSYGFDFQVGTSAHRGDLNFNFLYIGLSSDFRSAYDTQWSGVFSAGAIGLKQYNEDEVIVGPVGIFCIHRPFSKFFSFGPKLIFGTHNELGFSISSRF